MVATTDSPEKFDPTHSHRDHMIAEAAYFRAEKRGFEDSEEDRLLDWLAAESEIDALLEDLARTEVN
jgi:hypothetical protein